MLTSTAEWIAGWRYGVDWSAPDYLPGDWLHVPALVFHGTADDTVPLATTDAFRAAHPDLVQEVQVPGANHVESWNVDPAGYGRGRGPSSAASPPALPRPAPADRGRSGLSRRARPRPG